MQVAIFQFSLFGINTYLVFDPDTKECAVIDPGMSSPEEEKAIENFIAEKGLTLTQIINTHLHIDHVAGIPYLQKNFNVPVLGHEGDKIMGHRIDQQAKMFGLEFPVQNIEISEYIEAGDKIKIGNGELEVIAVPGHSKGSIALYDPQGGFLISGDALFKGSIGRTDLPGGNYRELIESINKFLLSLPDETIVLPGHGPSSTIGEEKRTNPFLV
ncbi:MAG: MBL fold metallo-hydrolase [Muribaculaceae bacterium]|nr:MBL fold metallo-hydrolase [Muribaculaceae bacterium]